MEIITNGIKQDEETMTEKKRGIEKVAEAVITKTRPKLIYIYDNVPNSAIGYGNYVYGNYGMFNWSRTKQNY